MPTPLDPSKLDKYFEPRPDPPAPLPPRRSADEVLASALIGGTRWQCEDRIRSALDAFVDTMGERWIPRSPILRRNLYASARPIVDEIGEEQAPAFVRWACAENARRRLDTKDLRSLVYLIPAWRDRATTPDWMKTPCRECSIYHAPGPCEQEDDDPQVIVADSSLSDQDVDHRREQQAIARRLRWPDADQADPPDDDR